MVSSSVSLTSCTASRIETERSLTRRCRPTRGSCASKLRQHGLDAVDHLDRVGVGLALDGQRDRALAVEPAGRLACLEAVLTSRDVAQPDRVAVAGGDDQVGELGGVGSWRVRLQGQRLARALERADRRVGVRRRSASWQLVEADVARRQRVGSSGRAPRSASAEDLDLRRRRRGSTASARSGARRSRSGPTAARVEVSASSSTGASAGLTLR